jgi:hypothetical protein
VQIGSWQVDAVGAGVNSSHRSPSQTFAYADRKSLPDDNSTHTTTTMAPQCVLMLGSGFVTRPTLDILSDAGIEVSVGESLARDTSHSFH